MAKKQSKAVKSSEPTLEEKVEFMWNTGAMKRAWEKANLPGPEEQEEQG